MNILGIVTKSHDTGLALLQSGQPAYILEEERFNRQKHTLEFPTHCLDTIFGDGRLSFDDIDVVTTPWEMDRLRPTFYNNVTSKLPSSLNLLRPAAHRVQASAIVNLPFRLWMGLGKRYGYRKVPKIVQVSHHNAHAAVFNVSPFEEAAVLVMDGYGDDTSTSGYIGQGTRIERVWQSHFFDSLGMLYTCVTEYLGFKVFEEGTVMALAACGGPTYIDRFKDLIQLLPDGQFRINRDYVSFDTHGLVRPFKWKFYETFGPPRSRTDPLTDHHRDIARALQAVIEETILHIVRDMEKRQSSRNLVISGGVGLNCVANARILRDTKFERVWVPPCASDTGAPLGSALWHWHQTLGNPRTFEMTHAFYGKGFTDAEIRAALDKAGLVYKKFEEADLLRLVAHLLSEQKIVGWFQGRAEMGPRALGNRSILSDARDNKIKDLHQRQDQAPRGLPPVRTRRAAGARARVLRGLPARPLHDTRAAHPPGQGAPDPRRRSRRWHRPNPDYRALREPALLRRHRGICQAHRHPGDTQHELQPAGTGCELARAGDLLLPPHRHGRAGDGRLLHGRPQP